MPETNTNGITVHEASTDKVRAEFVVVDGEPYVHDLVRLRGLRAAVALTDQAVVVVSNGRRSKSFVRVTWIAEMFSERRTELMEMRRRLLILARECQSTHSGHVQIDFTKEHIIDA